MPHSIRALAKKIFLKICTSHTGLKTDKNSNGLICLTDDGYKCKYTLSGRIVLSVCHACFSVISYFVQVCF